jgi:hypothetical protein
MPTARMASGPQTLGSLVHILLRRLLSKKKKKKTKNPEQSQGQWDGASGIKRPRMSVGMYVVCDSFSVQGGDSLPPSHPAQGHHFPVHDPVTLQVVPSSPPAFPALHNSPVWSWLACFPSSILLVPLATWTRLDCAQSVQGLE